MTKFYSHRLVFLLSPGHVLLFSTVLLFFFPFPESPPSNVIHLSELSLITCVNTPGQVYPGLIPPEPHVVQHYFLVPLIWGFNRVIPCFVIWFLHVCPVFPSGWKTHGTGIRSSRSLAQRGHSVTVLPLRILVVFNTKIYNSCITSKMPLVLSLYERRRNIQVLTARLEHKKKLHS